jgi:hypothetical protein
MVGYGAEWKGMEKQFNICGKSGNGRSRFGKEWLDTVWYGEARDL